MANTATPTFTTFGEMLKYLRQRARLTQDELGLAVGYSRAHVARLESNQRAPDAGAVRARFVEALQLETEAALAAQLIALAQAERGQGEAALPRQQVPNNLPVQLTSFIGREPEMMELQRLLVETRLLTLTGVGGVGKTRLALQLAGAVMDEYPDGVWLAELAPIAAGEYVARVVAGALGAHEEHGRPLLATLADEVRNKQLLLIVDNCEHVIEASAQLVEVLLRAGAGVRIIATSREALGTPGELAWPVPSLRMPAVDGREAPAELKRYDAVRLFVERAAFAQPAFVLSEKNMEAVLHICTRLDGIPLAIELAAVRMKALTADSIAQRLDDRFRLLTGGSRTVLSRQQTLRGVIDWSYRLLTEEERILLRWLSVFVGGWTLEAAEAVCAGEGIEVRDVLDLLSRLVDKSLVLADDGGAEKRYRLLETIRQYALEKLMDTEEGTQVRDRHLDYFIAMGEAEMQDFFKAADQVAMLAHLASDLDNIRRALDWASETGRIDAEFRLANVWTDLFMLLDAQVELLARLDRILAQPVTDKNIPARAVAFLTVAIVHGRQSEIDQMQVALDQAQAIALALGDVHLQARALDWLAFEAQARGEYALARSRIEQSSALLKAANINDEMDFGDGSLELAAGNYQQAEQLLSQALAATTATNKNQTSAIKRHLAYALIHQGKLAEAESLLRDSLIDNHALRSRVGVAACLGAYGILALARADLPRAARLFGGYEALQQIIHTPVMHSDAVQIHPREAALRARMDAADLKAAWDEGGALAFDLERAIAYALTGAAG